MGEVVRPPAPRGEFFIQPVHHRQRHLEPPRQSAFSVPLRDLGQGLIEQPPGVSQREDRVATAGEAFACPQQPPAEPAGFEPEPAAGRDLLKLELVDRRMGGGRVGAGGTVLPATSRSSATSAIEPSRRRMRSTPSVHSSRSPTTSVSIESSVRERTDTRRPASAGVIETMYAGTKLTARTPNLRA